MLSALFDPLGFVAPVSLLAKIILQNLCRKGIGWDESIPEVDREAWLKWVADLHALSRLRMPRCITPCTALTNCSVCLHHFSDASMTGYGSVTYLRVVTEEKKVHCSFMFAKARLTPIKSVSIPRLEMMAACLAMQVDAFIRCETNFLYCNSVFWTDSASVLQMIRNTLRIAPSLSDRPWNFAAQSKTTRNLFGFCGWKTP